MRRPRCRARPSPPSTSIFFSARPRANLKKLKAIAKDLGAVILTPYYPVSGLYRISRDDGLQLDFMTAIDGVRSFEGFRGRARAVSFGACKIQVASLADIIKSKKAAGRPRDLAVLEILEKALEESAGHAKREAGSSSEGE
jgi:hypothetical protein